MSMICLAGGFWGMRKITTRWEIAHVASGSATLRQKAERRLRPHW